MSVAVFICGVCALLGWHFIDAMLQAIDRLSGPMNSMPLRVAVQALLPGIPGLYLWSVATAFLLFAVIKFEPSWKQRHLRWFVTTMHIGRMFLWLTVPLAAVWVAANLYVSA